jgi:thioredoxin reductase/NAD-dependent dihydropyrimidine dehydrogenase PreA subunit
VSWLLPLVLAGLAVGLMAVYGVLGVRRRAQPAALVGPAVLVHDINDDRCTGCDACVAVCPTNVLDLVANKSRVLRFHDCIQCEQCVFACPTEALVMYPRGGTPPPLAVPEIDEHFQTAVPGQYLIGEVAGKPLVKNAANLGRLVVEHMLATGLYPGAIGRGPTTVDVAIVGSGPGGLSAALTCIQRGLSYVILEKEQLVASTVARYPKGKLVMAEPYDTTNLSLLPVFDSSKEVLLPIWQELFERTGLVVRRGEAVETIARAPDGTFDLRTTVAAYRAQRVVLSIGTRGKPRTLQVPGENLAKVQHLLEDPDAWRGRWVLVVGGGDSACEAALALADAGAMVILSYRGKSFARATPRNKESVEAYTAENRLRTHLGSQVVCFDADTVTLALADGTQQRYRNEAAFVLIGADPPVAWLEKVGVRFVERPHDFRLGKTDDLVRRLVPNAMPCNEDAARAAAIVLRQPVPPAATPQPMPAVMPPPPADPPAPKKWMQSATSIFATRLHKMGAKSPPPPPPEAMRGFAPRTSMLNLHSGDGRRDALQPQERTRILRMLRDDGGRLADDDATIDRPQRPARVSAAPPIVHDDEQVHIGAMPAATPPEPVRSRPAFLEAATVIDPGLEAEARRDAGHRWPEAAPATEPDAHFAHDDEPSPDPDTIYTRPWGDR